MVWDFAGKLSAHDLLSLPPCVGSIMHYGVAMLSEFKLRLPKAFKFQQCAMQNRHCVSRSSPNACSQITVAVHQSPIVIKI